MAGPTPSIEKLLKKLEKEPNPLVYLQLAEEYRREGLFQEALKTCQDGLQRHPNYWSARVSMGRIHYELGDPEKAREELEKVIKAVPDNLLANKLLGDIYRESGKYEDALKRYNLVQMLTPADAEVAASIRKIEHLMQSEAVQAPPEIPTVPVQVPIPEPESPASIPSSEEEPGFFSAPTEILERTDPPTPSFLEMKNAEEEKIENEKTRSIVLDLARSYTQPQQGEDEAIELQEDSDSEDVGELNTQTLADIYIQQGLPDKAVKVYQKLLLRDPGNSEIIQKLKELNPADVLLSAAGRQEPVRPPETRIREQEAPTSAARISQEIYSDSRRRKISTLESWLASIRRERA
jgi:tetratricopeptide (TPR) repeat protein